MALQGDEIDETGLLGRVERFRAHRIPPEVLLITVGADVQDDRIEVSYVGWAKDGTAFVLGHVVLHGPVTVARSLD